MTPDFLATVVLLLILLDPLGNIPLLISLLRPLAPARRQHVVLRENAIAAALLIVFVFIGDWLLAALRLSPSALEISGGLILFLIAMGMVFPRRGHDDDDLERDGEPLIVPIAVPMIAGPAALAMVLLTSHQQGTHMVSLVGAILVAIALNTIILLAGERLARLFGKPGLAAMERLMGLILTTMAVQMLISGIKSAFLLPIG
ncbi:MAG: MarC family protein [Rhodocyclaceae bacterium]|jgi:MarC family membrane protein|nr:MarC family protein [Rhodocyclaceae bacterium]